MVPEQDGSSSDVRLRAFVDAVFDAYYDWHIQSGLMETSKQMDALLRQRPGAFPRTFQAWLERVHPDDREEALRNNRLAVQRGGVYEGEYRMRRGDDTYVLVHDRGVILRDTFGRSEHMIGALRDVTRERAAERAQREAADLYHALFAQAVNPAFHIARDGAFLDANAAGLSHLKTTRRRLLRRNVADVWGRQADETIRSVLLVPRSGATLDLELDVAGTLRSLVITLVPCRFEDQPTCFALGTDITEHRTLRRALEASSESLSRQASALADANTALRVILEQRNRDRAELERTIVQNVESTIVPLLEGLRQKIASTPERIYADAAIHSLRDLVSPFAQSLDAATGPEARMSLREREIATLIRAGKSSREIAAALFISPTTVAFHRKNLRRKFGLGPRSPSLAAHLARLPVADAGRAADSGAGDA